MTKQIEAIKLALDALETGKPMFDAYWGGSQFDNAIAALREALDEPNSAVCAGCGKQASEGWALYCVACMEKVK